MQLFKPSWMRSSAPSDSDNKFIGIEHLSDEELEDILKEVEESAEKLHEERRKRERGDSKPPTPRRKTA